MKQILADDGLFAEQRRRIPVGGVRRVVPGRATGRISGKAGGAQRGSRAGLCRLSSHRKLVAALQRLVTHIGRGLSRIPDALVARKEPSRGTEPGSVPISTQEEAKSVRCRSRRCARSISFWCCSRLSSSAATWSGPADDSTSSPADGD